ncbi:MAG: hypothetical protein VX617_05720 [Pseudomonadota bacterium]|nr:hypothetical protein [Pseudomonadota bacterium]
MGDGSQAVSSLDAGPLSSNHQNFTSETGCVACHSAHNSGTMGWLKAALTPSNVSENCVECHSFRHPIDGAHNSETIALVHKQSTTCTMCHVEHKGANANITAITDSQCNSCHETKFDSFAVNHSAFSAKYPFDKRTAIAFNHSSHLGTYFVDKRYETNAPKNGCIGCHDISRGERAVPIRGFKDTCAACHIDTIRERPLVLFTFPEFEENPFNEAEVIKEQGLFPDQMKASRDSIEELTGKITGNTISELAAAAAEIRVTATLGVKAGKKAAIRVLANRMSNNAASLFSQNKSRFGTTARELLKTPISKLSSGANKATTFLSETAHASLLEAIEEIEDGLTTLSKQRYSTTNKELISEMKVVANLLSDKMEELEADEEFEAVSSETLPPIAAALMDIDGEEPDEYEAPVKSLISGVLNDGVEAFAKLISNAGGEPELLLQGLTGDLITPAAASWAANREYEVSSASVKGGWHANELSLSYQPTQHGDAVMKAWLEFAVSKGTGSIREVLLDRSEGPGACIKCHAISNKAYTGKSTSNGVVQSETTKKQLVVEWKSNPGKGNPHVKYSHKPHVNLLGPGSWCSSCHKLNSSAKFDESFLQDDPTKFSSNFKSIDKNICSDCHAVGQVSQGCTTCHNYHIDPGFKKTMMSQLSDTNGKEEK